MFKSFLKTTAKKNQLFLILLTAIVLLSLIIRLYRLDQPHDFYFDEVYHAFTAINYLHNNRVAYDIWATPPAGVAYEWVHPPLAKLIMAGSMAIFGENSFGWRISSVFFGTGIIVMTAMLAKKLFHSRRIALLASTFLALDGLLLAQSRIAMNDTHFIFFALCGLYCYLGWKDAIKYNKTKLLALTGVFLGLALATKWTTLYVFGLLLTDLFSMDLREKLRLNKKLILQLITFFVAIPTALYLASYAQLFLHGYSWTYFQDMQAQIWWYHTNLKATHPFQSNPIQWILDLRPVWLWVGRAAPGMVANMYNIANPIFLWSGLIAFFVGLKSLFKKWNSALWFTLIWYLWMWLPWMKSPRIMFFYHYLPALPALSILLALLCYAFWTHDFSILVKAKSITPRKKISRKIVVVTISLALLWLIVFYPNVTGIPVPQSFAESIYFFISSWR